MAKKKPATEEVETKFEHYVEACIEIVAEFRDLLAAETSRIMLAKADKPESFDPAKHSHLHRMRLASDGFLSALSGQF
jgi:hypothetical protein